MTLTYRTGQAARELGVSSHYVRRLCEAGDIRGAEVTDGNRWRIPVAEVERLKKEGVPPLPQLPSEEIEARQVRGRDRAGVGFVSDPPPEENEDPEVRSERNSVSIAENRLRRRRLELEQEDVEESFRERERKRLAELQQQSRAAERKRWSESWIKSALQSVPSDCPGEIRLQVHARVQEVLNRLQVDQPAMVVGELVNAAVEAALLPHTAAKCKRSVADAAVRMLPYDKTHQDEEEARLLAYEAVFSLPDSATHSQMAVAVAAAIKPVLRRIEHAEKVREALYFVEHRWGVLDDFRPNWSEREAAVKAVKEAIQDVPVGGDLDRVLRRILRPMEAAVKEREEKEKRIREVEQYVREGLEHLSSYLRCEYQFDSYTDLHETERELEDELRPALSKLLRRGELPMSRKAVDDLVEKFTDAKLENDDEDEDEDDE